MASIAGYQHHRVNEAQLGYAPNGAVASDGFSILFDGKSLNADDASRWNNEGTGTFAFSNNKVLMSVASGEYAIRQSSRRIPYFSGYPLYIEETFDNFSLEAGVTKRVGYFSSSTSAPYTANLDGFWLENDGTTYRFVAYRDGTETVNVPMSSWSGSKHSESSYIGEYIWANFTAVMFDFLWLGGAALRLWLCTPKYGWILAHGVPYIGNAMNTVTKTPQHHLRYEIRGDSAAGSMRMICAQASVLGKVAGNADRLSIPATASVSCNTTTVVYALAGVKLNATYPDLVARVSMFNSVTGSTNDTGMLMLLKNPTLSAGLSYSAAGRIDHAYGTGQTVSDLGTVLTTAPSGLTSQSLDPDNYLSWMSKDVDGTAAQYVLAFQPATTNQSVRASLEVMEYS